MLHAKRLPWLSRTISAWNTAPFDPRSRNLLPGKCVFSRCPSSTRPDPRPQDCQETTDCYPPNPPPSTTEVSIAIPAIGLTMWKVATGNSGQSFVSGKCEETTIEEDDWRANRSCWNKPVSRQNTQSNCCVDRKSTRLNSSHRCIS